MSDIKVDSITDLAGTGAPDFPQGLQVAGAASVSALQSGEWTPTVTGVSNVSSVEPARVHHYLRIGDRVMISGSIGFTPSSSGNFSLRISLPFASNFSDLTDASGGGGCNVGEVNSLLLQANSSNNEINVNGAVTTVSGNTDIGFSGIYKII